MTTYIEAVALEESLPKSGSVAWPVGKVINALLDEAKRESPNSISLAAIDPLRPGPHETYIAGVNAESLRAMVAVIRAALESGPGPRLA